MSLSMKPRVLIVDDAATVRFALFSLLGDRFDVHVAMDAETGIEIARDIQPHLILMDVVMPGMDGFAACRALRADALTVMTPIIMVTSQDEEWDVEAGFAAGCTDYVRKPVDKIELLMKMDTWLAALLGPAAA
jgi:PleD family two-component response regulator